MFYLISICLQKATYMHISLYFKHDWTAVLDCPQQIVIDPKINILLANAFVTINIIIDNK